MKQVSSNRIKLLRASRGLSQAELAEALGAHWITVSKLERGKLRLTQDWMNRIAKVLAVTPSELIEDGSSPQTIYIEGEILSDHGKYVVKQRDESIFKPMYINVELGTVERDRDLWVTVMTDGFYPIVQAGDMVRFTYIDNIDDIYHLVGRLCLVHSGKTENPTVGILRETSEKYVFDLDVPGRAPIRKVKADEIAIATIILCHPQIIGSALVQSTKVPSS